MKVLHITTTDYGGAFEAASNISRSMQAQGVDSKIMVREATRDTQAFPYLKSAYSRFRSKTKNVGNLLLSDRDIVFDYFGSAVTKSKEFQEADLVFLHWVNSFLGDWEITKMQGRGKKIVWVLHDMWPFTGGCHYDMNCEQYENGCQNCPLTQKKERVRQAKRRKAGMIRAAGITGVGCSKWMADCAKSSGAFGDNPVYHIPNPVDTDIFHPYPNRGELRDKYNLSRTDKVVLFGAMTPEDKRKGLDLLVAAADYLDDSYVLGIAGNMKTQPEAWKNKRIHMLGYADSREQMAEIYNLADAFVIPSRQENLSNSVTEAMACGVPVAAFDIGGMPDMIIHGETGFLAEPFSQEELARGISYCIEKMSENKEKIREKAMRFSFDEIGKKYVELCEKLL